VPPSQSHVISKTSSNKVRGGEKKKKAEMGMKLENVVLTEMSDNERQILYDITYM